MPTGHQHWSNHEMLEEVVGKMSLVVFIETSSIQLHQLLECYRKPNSGSFGYFKDNSEILNIMCIQT